MADQYWSFVETGVSGAQANTIKSNFNSLSRSGVSISLIEYNPITSSMGIHVGGPDLTAIKTAIRNLFQSRLGKLPTTDTSSLKGVKLTTGADSVG